MDKSNQPKHKKKNDSNRTRNILITIIIILAVILIAVLVPLTFCSRQDLGDGSGSKTEEGEGTNDITEEFEVLKQEGTIDRISDKYIELDIDGTIVLIYLDSYSLPEDLSAGDEVYVEYKVDKTAEQSVLVYLKILKKAEQPSDKPDTINHVGIIDRINKDSIYLKIITGVVLIYIDGYELPNDLAAGDKIYVEYEVDKNAEQNILKYLEVIEKSEKLEAPGISIEIYEGPVYIEEDNICYYRIAAIVTGKPEPEISWSRDDSDGGLGAGKSQISLKDFDEKYTLEATAKNSEGTDTDKIEIKWGCEKPSVNRPPEIKEIVIIEDFYIDTKYPVYVVATDPDGDELSYKWSISAGTVEKSTSNPMLWTTPAFEGKYQIKVTVNDGNDGVATETKNVEVKQEEQSPEPPDGKITDVIWQWEKFISNDNSETVISDPNQYMFLLTSDGKIYLLADCNSGSGKYILRNSSLTLNIEVVTRAICEPDSLSDQYISYLGDVVTYVLEEGKLYLNLKADAGNMVFRNVEITPF